MHTTEITHKIGWCASKL